MSKYDPVYFPAPPQVGQTWALDQVTLSKLLDDNTVQQLSGRIEILQVREDTLVIKWNGQSYVRPFHVVAGINSQNFLREAQTIEQSQTVPSEPPGKRPGSRRGKARQLEGTPQLPLE
jgi:hypothetical protein